MTSLLIQNWQQQRFCTFFGIFDSTGHVSLKNNVINANGHVIDTAIEEADWTAGKAGGRYPSDSTWAASATKPNYQSIDQSKLVPLLVKTIQELEARITALES